MKKKTKIEVQNHYHLAHDTNALAQNRLVGHTPHTRSHVSSASGRIENQRHTPNAQLRCHYLFMQVFLFLMDVEIFNHTYI